MNVELKNKVLHNAHNSKYIVRLGMNKMYQDMNKDIANFVTT